MTAIHSPTTATAQQDRVRWKAVVLFLVIAYGLGWAIGSILWFTGGLMPGGHLTPLFLPVGIPVMCTPAIAALLVTLTVLKPAHPARFLGLAPLRPIGRTVGYCVLGVLGAWAVTFATVLLAVAVGVAPFRTSGSTVALLVSIVPASLLTAVAALGEELGWRGFLLPALRPLGTGRAILISGLVWGPWHAPLVLLGYNYATTNPVALIPMTVTTVLMGAILAWVRMRSASVYPSSFAHGALNGSAGTAIAALLPAGAAASQASVLSLPGWVVMAVVVAALVLTRSYRWARQVPLRTAEPVPAVDAPEVAR